MSEISLYIDRHLVGKCAKCIFSRRMWMVFGFGLNHTSESSVRAKYTIYLPSFLAAIHYYVAFPLVDLLFITKEPLLIPKVSHGAYRITGNFCGVKFLQFWSKKKTFKFCGFFFLRIENLGTEKKIVCITGSNNWSDVTIKNWCTLQWSLEVKTYLVL